MTPKEKANQIIDRMNGHTYEDVINNALFLVDEIIKERYFHNGQFNQNTKLKYHIELELSERLQATREYWESVKKEIITNK